MSVTVVGSVALDTVETPWGKSTEGLGGAATFFALAAANFTRVNLIGIVGDDFPREYLEILRGKNINLEGLECVPGKTFRWSGRYHADVNLRDTLDTQLNVFEQFHPRLPEETKDADYLFLGNIHPSLQFEVLEQSDHKFTALDTMNLWIHNTPQELGEVMARVDCVIINDSEARELTGHINVIEAVDKLFAIGPRIVVVKKGEHGCLLFTPQEVFALPALPLRDVLDPTGAGDSFAGGFMGHIARAGNTETATLRQAVVYGSVVASFACESFGPIRLAQVTEPDIEARFRQFRDLTAF
jgi:sugar/nucleoside kinase (ribokinase family)